MYRLIELTDSPRARASCDVVSSSSSATGRTYAQLEADVIYLNSRNGSIGIPNPPRTN
jgi:hypothetical protein